MKNPNAEVRIEISRVSGQDNPIPTQMTNIKRLLANSDDIHLIEARSTAPENAALEVKSDPTTFAAIVMAFISGGAATTLINAIRATHPKARDSAVEYSVTLKDNGEKLHLSAKNLSLDQTTSILEKWNEIIGFTKN